MKNNINPKLVVLVLFCLFFIKVLIISPTFVESSILFILGLILSYFEFKINDKKIEDLSNQIKSHKEDIDLKIKELNNMKNRVDALSLSQVKGNARTY